MNSREIRDKVGKELEALAQSHGVCIAAVIATSESEEALTVVTNPLASPPLTLLRATLALEDQAARFVAENAPEAFETLINAADTVATQMSLARRSWTQSE
jgi:hypothetical protein